MSQYLLQTLAMSGLILAIWLLFHFFPKVFPARVRYFTWVILLVGLLIPVRPQFGTTVIEIPVQEEIVIVPQLPVAPTPIQATSNFRIWPWIWLAGTAIVLLYHLVRYVKFYRAVRRWGEVEKDDKILSIFEKVKREMGLERARIQLMTCSLVSSSMLTGFFRPLVLLPEKELDHDELELIFKHELVHYKRKDLPIKFLSLLAIAVNWFNPLVYLLGFSLQEEGEAACDEAVLKSKDPSERHFYAEVIIGMIGKRKGATFLATNFYGGKNGIKKRLEAILEHRTTASPLSYGLLIAVLALTVGTGSVFAMGEVTYVESERAHIKEIALGLIGGGHVQHIEDLHDVDFKRFNVTVVHDEQIFILEIDVESGEVLSMRSQPYGSEPLPNFEPALGELTGEQAVAIAKSVQDGSLIDLDREAHAWYVAIAVGNWVHEFYIDFEGVILSHEIYEN